MLVTSTSWLLISFFDVIIIIFIFLIFLLFHIFLLFIILKVLFFNHLLKLLYLLTIEFNSHLLCNSYQIRWNLVFKVIFVLHIFLIIVLYCHFISAVIFVLIVLILAFSNNSSNFSSNLIFIIEIILLRIILFAINVSSLILISRFFPMAWVYLFCSCNCILDVKGNFILFISVLIITEVLKFLVFIFRLFIQLLPTDAIFIATAPMTSPSVSVIVWFIMLL